MVMTSLGAGIAAGATRAATEQRELERERPFREARLAEARTRQQHAEAQLDEFMTNRPARDQMLAMQVQNMDLQTRKNTDAYIRDKTYQAFDKFTQDRDARHINTFIEEVKQIDPDSPFAQVARVDRLDGISYQDGIQMMRDAGIENPEDIYEDVKDSFLVATDAAGNRQLRNIEHDMAATGYNRHASTQQLKEMQQRYQITNLVTGPQTAETKLIRDMAKELKIPLSEAVKRYKEASASRMGSTLERIAQTIKENNPHMSDEEALAEASVLMKSGGTAAEREAAGRAGTAAGPEYQASVEEVTARKERSSARVQLDEAQEVRTAIDEASGGSLFDADLTDPTVRRKVGPYITELEKLTGKEMTTEDKRLTRNIRELTSLGGVVGENLTEQEAGIMDKMLRGFKAYVSSEVDDGTRATAAYEQFRNIYRNALYGASLTNSEIKAFESAQGNLGQQAGPVLAKLNESMRSMRTQLQAIYDTNDEYVAQYYMGRSLDEIDGVIEAIDQRIEQVSGGMDKGMPTTITAQPAAEQASKKPVTDSDLDAIFGAQ